MAITRWDPFGEMLSLQREMDRLFGRLGSSGPRELPSSVAWMPRMDVKTSGDDMVVHAELPGMKRDDIAIDVTDGLLTIKGERTAESQSAGEDWLIRERSYGSFERSLLLPEGVDAGKITADYKDGVLEVHVPKAAEALKPKTHHIELGPART